MRLHRLLPLPILALLICGCQPQPGAGPQDSGAAGPAPAWPLHDYEASALAGNSVFRLDPRNTRIDIVVRRDGPLARFGHDHVVTVSDPEGFLQYDPEGRDSRADIRFRVDRLVVDSEEARERHGLTTDPDEADIEGTRNNLMLHVLDAGRWPWAGLTITGFKGHDGYHSALLGITIRDSDYSSVQPFRLGNDGGRVVVEGFLLLRQTELGIEPFSTLGGGLRVADAMEVHFRIEAGPY